MKSRALSLFANALAGFTWFVSQHAYAEESPRMADILSMEAGLKMPEHASPLANYARYYAFQTVAGRQILVGTYLATVNKNGIHIVPPGKLPVVFDGGCSVIDVEFDLEKKTMVNISCHGQA